MNLSKSWVLQIDPSVFKKLKRMPQSYAERMLFVIQSMPSDPFSGDIQKMKGQEHVWRRRIGAYRIFYELLPKESLIHVFHIERRTSKTY